MRLCVARRKDSFCDARTGHGEGDAAVQTHAGEQGVLDVRLTRAGRSVDEGHVPVSGGDGTVDGVVHGPLSGVQGGLGPGHLVLERGTVVIQLVPGQAVRLAGYGQDEVRGRCREPVLLQSLVVGLQQ